jgi:2-oxoglutarate ferredoxin oxidoreductase subunit alpha
VPQPVLKKAARETRFGVIYYGSTSPAMAEAFDALQEQGVHIDHLRIRAFPFSAAVDRFVAEHESVFVVEQNRDAQLRMMLINEQEIAPAKLEPILHYDGTPITARFIIEAIAKRVRADNVEPIRAKKKGKAAA